jgi:hypothetical protein
MRLPAGLPPVDSTLSKEEADRKKLQEDEVSTNPCYALTFSQEFEKFLNDVADGEAKLKAREDAERQKDWEDTQEYLKQKKDAREAKPSAVPAPTSGMPIQAHSAHWLMLTAPIMARGESKPILSPPAASSPLSTSPSVRHISPHATSPRAPQPQERSFLSPERARVAGQQPADGTRERAVAAVGFKSPSRPQLFVNPGASPPITGTASPPGGKSWVKKTYELRHVVRLQALARRWLVLNGRRKKGTH